MSSSTTHRQQHLLVFLVLLVCCWVGVSVAAPLVEQRHGGDGEKKGAEEVARPEMDEGNYHQLSIEQH